jgi:hypothetical protein
MSSSIRFSTSAVGMNFYLNDLILKGNVAEYRSIVHLFDKWLTISSTSRSKLP